MLYRCKIVIQIDCAGLERPKINTKQSSEQIYPGREKVLKKKTEQKILPDSEMGEVFRTGPRPKLVRILERVWSTLVQIPGSWDWLGDSGTGWEKCQSAILPC